MVRGAEYRLLLPVKNKATGELITDPELVADIELVLRHSGSSVGVKRYMVDEGVEDLGDGTFKLTIAAEDTLLLPTKGKAFLEGFVLPCKKSIKIDLGNISDNTANYPIPGEDE
jgi:hypothetical protein